MTNINNGGRSPIAGIVHAVVLLLILLFLMPLAQYIPMACLAGILVIVSYNMSGWRVFKGLLKNPKSEHLIIPQGVEVYEINGPYFFGIATKFEEIMARLGDRPQIRIIRMRKVPFIDSTGIHNLTTLCKMSQKENINIILSGVNEKVHAVLEKSGFYELLGKENICSNINEALEVARREIEQTNILKK